MKLELAYVNAYKTGGFYVLAWPIEKGKQTLEQRYMSKTGELFRRMGASDNFIWETADEAQKALIKFYGYKKAQNDKYQ